MSKYFKISLTKEDFQTYNELVSKGKTLYQTKKDIIQQDISDYILPSTENDCVDLSKVQRDWFPQFEDFDIFISHSHDNEELAIALAYYLESRYGLTSFIDSLVWGNVFNLQKKIDEKYCVNKKDEKGKIISYSYEKRNFTTSHVHLMLNTALMQSMQVAKFFFFINTQDSINFKNIKGEWTYSPWIYSELSMSKSMYELEKDSTTKPLFECVGNFSKIPLIQKAQTSHLTSITKKDLDNCCNGKTGSIALEALKNFSPKTYPTNKSIGFYVKSRW